MAYGDTGVGGAKAPSPFAKLLPWTWGKLVGTDGTGKAKTADVQYLIDSGALVPAIASTDLTNFSVVFRGVRGYDAHGESVAGAVLQGPTLQAQATDPAVKDLKATGPFLLLTFQNAVSVLGGAFWADVMGSYKVDIKGKKVTISG